MGQIGPSAQVFRKIDNLSMNCSSVDNVKKLMMNEFIHNLHPELQKGMSIQCRTLWGKYFAATQLFLFI